jgi:branched-chain amino acid transport system permease protein
VNLAQASFSMAGGYAMIVAMRGYNVPFLAGLPIAFVVAAAISILLERLVLRHFQGTDDLTQVLLTIGLVFMSIAIVTYVWGGAYQRFDVPEWLSGRRTIMGVGFESYRVFLVVVGALLSGLLILGLERTRFGAMVRACVDNQRVASACGLNTQLIFATAFAIGGGLAGLGGALAANVLGLDPNFPLRYLVYLLIVVSVGGMGTVTGTLVAAMALGVSDVMGKYYFPQFGGIAIYVVTVALMLWRPQGLMGRRA